MTEQRTLRDFVLASRWRFERVVGAGADGTVYLAFDIHTGAPVAIKVFDSMVDEDIQVVIHRIESEARLVQLANSPWLVQFIAHGVAPARGGKKAAYAVMEFLTGDTLRNRMRTIEPGGAFAFDAFGKLLNGVNALHSVGWVHMDIKPENVFVLSDRPLSADGSVKLYDFGNARVVEHAFTVGARGTPLYAAPELCARTGEVGFPTDLYSLGIILFELMVGRAPMPIESVEQIVSTHVYGQLDSMPRTLPDWLRILYRRATARNPAQRYANAADMLQAWNEGVASLPSAEVLN